MPAALLALAGCGGGGGSGSAPPAHSFSTSSPNVVTLTVGPGPKPANSAFNIASTSVTVCMPGTNTCATIAHVLVDTGSTGLRLLASALNSAGLKLPLQGDSNPITPGNTIAECLPFADGYTWGPVATADISIGGEGAKSLPVNIIDDSQSFAPPPMACTSNGANIGTVDGLGANGVLGVGLFAQDCGSYCAMPPMAQTMGVFYYSCTPGAGAMCAAAAEPVASQVTNPVALFATDNNGVILQLPSIPATGAATASGFLVFGIGTENNNGLNGATVLTTNNAALLVATYKNQTLTGSFIDSGSNALFFPDNTIPTCSMAASFYCPASTLSLQATLQGMNNAMANAPFQITDIQQLSNADFAVDDVGGPAMKINFIGSSYFDFGLPFFYGRTVFNAIEGRDAGGAVGPYYAF
jgi:hypothetical protein